MTKKKKDLMTWLTTIITLIVAIGIGGLFAVGEMTGVPLLSYLPLIVHQVVGWIVIGGSILNFVLGLR